MLNLTTFFFAMCLCLIPAWFDGQAGCSWAGEPLKVTSLGGPAAPSHPIRSFVLEPYYFFQERQGRVQVERVIITLEIPVGENKGMADWGGEKVRSAFYRILTQGMDQASQQPQAQELLRRKFGQPKPATVKITRSVLLMP